MVKTIAIIGADGQIGSALTALLLDSNNIEGLSDEDHVKVIGIGKYESKRFQYMKDNGIKIHFRNPATTELRFVPCDSNNDALTKDLHYQVCDDNRLNLQELSPEIDHIIVCTKAFSHDQRLSKTIHYLLEHKVKDPTKTTITIAQNGISKFFLSNIITEHKTVLPKDWDEYSSINDEFVRSFEDKSKFLSCVLNIACQPYIPRKKLSNEIDEEGVLVQRELDFCEYDISTPRHAINIPIASTYPDIGNPSNLDDIKSILVKANIGIVNSPVDLEIFKKLQVNMMNALCTIFDCDIGTIINSEPSVDHPIVYKDIYFALTDEVEKVAAHSITTISRLRSNEQLKERLQNSKFHRTSTNIDFEQGKKLELDALFGTINKIAEGCDIKLRVIPHIIDAMTLLEKLRDNCPMENATINDRVAYARGHEKLQPILENIMRATYSKHVDPPTKNRTISHDQNTPSTSFELLKPSKRSTTLPVRLTDVVVADNIEESTDQKSSGVCMIL